MTETLRPDLCVIGAGAAGLSVAAGAARLGVPTVLVEKGTMGGDCLNAGCVPSKTLLACAAAAHASGVAPDWPAVRARVRETIAAIAPVDSAARYRAMGVTVIEAAGRFVDRRTLAAGEVLVRARRFVIATGARPAAPSIPGLDAAGALTSETIFDVDERPAHLLVLGAGPIGVELAQAFRRLGSAVTLIEAGRALSREDADIAKPVIDQLLAEGVAIREGVRATRVERAPDGVRVVIERNGAAETLSGSHLLLAVGRAPFFENLGLDQAGVDADARGVRVDAGLRTSNARVYAVGDVTGGPFFTHAANHQASLVLRSALFRLPARFRPTDLPRVTFTDPELAAVGLDETQARARHRRLRVIRAAFKESDRAATDGDPRGSLKALVTPRGRVLGAAIVGARAGDLLAPWTLAVAGRLTIRDIAATVAPYPTLSEVSRKAAIGFYAETFDRPIVRRILRWLRRLG